MMPCNKSKIALGTFARSKSGFMTSMSDSKPVSACLRLSLLRKSLMTRSQCRYLGGGGVGGRGVGTTGGCNGTTGGVCSFGVGLEWGYGSVKRVR